MEIQIEFYFEQMTSNLE